MTTPLFTLAPPTLSQFAIDRDRRESVEENNDYDRAVFHVSKGSTEER